MPKGTADRNEALIWSCERVGLKKRSDQINRDFTELERELANFLNRLIATHFDRVIAILYRIDIPQEKATLALAQNKGEEIDGRILSRLIIARQLQKLITKRKYRHR